MKFTAYVLSTGEISADYAKIFFLYVGYFFMYKIMYITIIVYSIGLVALKEPTKVNNSSESGVKPREDSGYCVAYSVLCCTEQLQDKQHKT